jgi:hypothetical protein
VTAGIVDQPTDCRLVVEHRSSEALGAVMLDGVRVVILFGHVDTDEHVDVPMVEAAHPISIRVDTCRDARTARPPSTTLRISPEAHVPVRGQPRPDSTGGNTPQAIK